MEVYDTLKQLHNNWARVSGFEIAGDWRLLSSDWVIWNFEKSARMREDIALIGPENVNKKYFQAK